VNHDALDNIEILLPGGLMLLSIEWLKPTRAWQHGVRLELMMRRPWDEDPPEAPDAGLTFLVGPDSFLIHGHQSIF